MKMSSPMISWVIQGWSLFFSSEPSESCFLVSLTSVMITILVITGQVSLTPMPGLDWASPLWNLSLGTTTNGVTGTVLVSHLNQIFQLDLKHLQLVSQFYLQQPSAWPYRAHGFGSSQPLAKHTTRFFQKLETFYILCLPATKPSLNWFGSVRW